MNKAAWILSTLSGLILMASSVGAQGTLSSATMDSAISIIGSEPAGSGGVNKNLGWDFQVNETITVTALGFRDRTCNLSAPICPEGFAQQHEVGIWDSNQNLIAYVMLPAGTVAEKVDGKFRYLPIQPVELVGGQVYTIGAFNPSPDDDGSSFGANGLLSDLQFDPRITFVRSRYVPFVAAFGFPNGGTTYGKPFLGPNFLIQGNAPPVADAGDDIGAAVGEIVQLSGLRSSDPETPSLGLIYQWTRFSAPSGSLATLENAGIAQTRFKPDLPGEYVFSLVVTDPSGLSSSADQMTITAEIDPAFAFERRASGLLIQRRGPYSYEYSYNHFQPYGLVGGRPYGTGQEYSYAYDWSTGQYTYSYDWDSRISWLDAVGEDTLVARGDPMPGIDGASFDYVWVTGRAGSVLAFAGQGRDANGQYRSGE